MNIKSLLLGSAAVLVAVTGARAADAVVVAEPEPVEYVRVCDVYGAGYFYIPGTETCLRISGYYRADVFYVNEDTIDPDDFDIDIDSDGYSVLSRFAPSFTVKSETALGTLTGNAELFFNWDSSGFAEPQGNSTELAQAWISLAGITIGKQDSPYSRFLGYGGPLNYYDGVYGFNDDSFELSYTFEAGGFEAIIAAVEDPEDVDYTPDFEGGLKYKFGWGTIGAMAGYDESVEEWGAKIALRYAPEGSRFGASIQGLYASEDDFDYRYSLEGAEFSVLAGASFAFTPKLTLNGQFQWFDNDRDWDAGANLTWAPVENLTITPEVLYSSFDDEWRGLVRFQRGF